MKRLASAPAEERPVFVNGYVLLARSNCFPPGINDVCADLDRCSATNFHNLRSMLQVLLYD